jgi:hypothetical protein
MSGTKPRVYSNAYFAARKKLAISFKLVERASVKKDSLLN